VLEDFLQQIAARVVADGFRIGDSLAQIAERFGLRLEIAFEDLFDVLAYQQLVEVLQIG
jgi:hypothetical protein